MSDVDAVAECEFMDARSGEAGTMVEVSVKLLRVVIVIFGL